MKNKIIKFKIATLVSIPLFLFSFMSVFAETMTMSFTIEGSSGSVTKTANYMTFKWNSTNISYCSASASNHYNWSGNKKISGTEQIFVGWPGTITYKLTCFNSEGKSISRSVGVTIPSTISTTKNTTTGSALTTNINSTTNSVTTKNSLSSCNMKNVTNFATLVSVLISCFFTPIVYLIVSLSVLLFVFGVFKFIRSEGEDRTRGKEFMLWGIIGLFVMVSIWGLVAILQNTFSF